MTYFILKVEKSNIEKTNLEVLQILLDKLELCQWALNLGYINKNQLIVTIQRAYHKVSKLKFALFTLTTTFKEFFSKL